MKNKGQRDKGIWHGEKSRWRSGLNNNHREMGIGKEETLLLVTDWTNIIDLFIFSFSVDKKYLLTYSELGNESLL